MTLPPMNMITVQELARVLAERKKLEESVARSFVSTMFDVVRVALERDKLVKVKGLGTFKDFFGVARFLARLVDKRRKE